MRLLLPYAVGVVGQYPDLIILKKNLVYLINLVVLLVVGLDVPSKVVFVSLSQRHGSVLVHYYETSSSSS